MDNGPLSVEECVTLEEIGEKLLSADRKTKDLSDHEHQIIDSAIESLGEEWNLHAWGTSRIVLQKRGNDKTNIIVKLARSGDSSLENGLSQNSCELTLWEIYSSSKQTQEYDLVPIIQSSVSHRWLAMPFGTQVVESDVDLTPIRNRINSEPTLPLQAEELTAAQFVQLDEEPRLADYGGVIFDFEAMG